MKQNLITDVVQRMLPYLNSAQAEKLQMICVRRWQRNHFALKHKE